jgi:hypothetical protein
VPEWIPDDFRARDYRAVMIGPDDEIALETEDIGDEGTLSYDLGAPRSFDDQVPPFDALAYYLPFHFFQARWGIYLSESGVLELTRHIVGGNRLAPTDRWVVGFAARALFLHEFFHHAAEVACARIEFPLPTTWLGTSHYNTYFTDPAAAGNEEALANAYVAPQIRKYYSFIGTRPRTKSYWNLRSFMDHQPGPYAKYREFLRDDDYANARDGMVNDMYIPWLPTSTLADRSKPGELLGAGMYFANVTPAASEYPFYLVLDRPGSHLRVARPFPKMLGLQVFVYSNDHTPVHIHVPRSRCGHEHTISLANS